MNSKRIYFVLIGLIILINGAGIAAVYFGNKLLTKQTAKLTELKVESQTLDDTQRSLSLAKKDLVKYSGIEQVVKTVIPQEKDQARTVREIIKIAQDSNISINSISFPSSTLGNDPKKSTAAAQAPAATTQTKKVEGINNVERLEITVTSDASKPVLYSNFLKFMSDLEQNRRTSQVSSINIVPDSENGNLLTFTMTLNVYIKK